MQSIARSFAREAAGSLTMSPPTTRQTTSVGSISPLAPSLPEASAELRDAREFNGQALLIGGVVGAALGLMFARR